MFYIGILLQTDSIKWNLKRNNVKYIFFVLNRLIWCTKILKVSVVKYFDFKMFEEVKVFKYVLSTECVYVSERYYVM